MSFNGDSGVDSCNNLDKREAHNKHRLTSEQLLLALALPCHKVKGQPGLLCARLHAQCACIQLRESMLVACSQGTVT